MKAVEFERVSKRFGRISALKEVSFEVLKGQSVALLGPNGAGKTTIVKLIGGIMRPTRGEVRVFGKVPWRDHEVRRLIGVVSHNPFLYDELTVYENLKFYCKMYNADEGRIDDVLEMFGLKGRRNDQVRNLSRGLKQRVSIARAIIHDPPLLVLDEPTTGLDIKSREELLGYIEEICGEKTLIMATHNVEEVGVCESVMIIRDGRVVYFGELEGEIKELYMRYEGKGD